ncbi:MAG: response regulator [Thermodesulfobacteriota bacterium]
MAQKTILVVDDAPEHLELLVRLLKDKYTVKAANNGDIALEIAQSPDPPDLILLDIVMPGKDGIEVCEILKKNEATAHIPVVFLSGMAGGEDCERGMELGGAAYLKKPIDVESLFSLLEVFLVA